ncbi:MAG TPA: hypothetical protein VM164_07375 [Burkholderiales bacterium]|nr:hypothetical protein [Burkholderiales bacterium]
MLRTLAKFFSRDESTFDAAKPRDPYLDVLRQLQADAIPKAAPPANGVSRSVLPSVQPRARAAEGH